MTGHPVRPSHGRIEPALRSIAFAFIGLATAVMVGIPVGYIQAARSSYDPGPPTAASFHAIALSTGLNYGANLALLLVPFGLLAGAYRGRRTPPRS